MLQQIWELWLAIDEPVGLVLGLVVVWLLIRQNLWAWPLGVAYVFVSVTVLLEARLYANLALHLIGFLPLNLYGWYHWLYGGTDVVQKSGQNGDASTAGGLPVTFAGLGVLWVLLAFCAAGTALLGTAFATFTDAALPYWDNALFVGSLAAMWLTARKKIENWAFWFVINVVSVGVYWTQGLPLYAGLYLIYIGMAVAGWRTWQRTMTPDARAAALR